MKQAPIVSMVAAVLIAVGCGSKPQEASATTEARPQATAAQSSQPSASAQPTAGSGSIQGVIRYSGAAPTQEKVAMDADPVCKQQHPSPVYKEELVVGANGALQSVLVYVKEGVKGTFPSPKEPVVLNQVGCWYAPHVFGIQVNQPFEIVNSDPTLHNVNAKPTVNTPFNIAQPTKGMKSTKTFTKPEIGVKFKCNVHPWMSAYAGVVEHPFFSVTNANGSFAITGLPAGTYVVEAWHEKLGTKTQTVTVGEGETQSFELTFAGQ